MSDITAPPAGSPKKSLVGRLLGVVISPQETFQAVAAHPSWLAVALVLIVLTGGAQYWFQSTEIGRQATLDETVRRTESFGFKVSDQMYEQMRQAIMEPQPWRLALSAVSLAVVPPIIWVAIAGVLFLVFAATGGQATFSQVFAVVVHSAIIPSLGALIMTPVNYFRQTLSSATNLGVFVPFLPEGSFVARLLGMVDLFAVWWVLVLATGLAVVYRKKTRSVALGLFVVYGAIAVAIAAIMAMRSTS
jgi:hypothetical protein